MKRIAFIKIRTTPERLEQLKGLASKAGKPVSTFAYQQLERASHDVQQAAELAELKGQVQSLVVLVQRLPQQSREQDSENKMALHELKLLVRELAMHINAQIVARVAAQLKTQL